MREMNLWRLRTIDLIERGKTSKLKTKYQTSEINWTLNIRYLGWAASSDYESSSLGFSDFADPGLRSEDALLPFEFGEQRGQQRFGCLILILGWEVLIKHLATQLLETNRV